MQAQLDHPYKQPVQVSSTCKIFLLGKKTFISQLIRSPPASLSIRMQHLFRLAAVEDFVPRHHRTNSQSISTSPFISLNLFHYWRSWWLRGVRRRVRFVGCGSLKTSSSPAEWPWGVVGKTRGCTAQSPHGRRLSHGRFAVVWPHLGGCVGTNWWELTKSPTDDELLDLTSEVRARVWVC